MSLSREEYVAVRARTEVEDLVAQYGDVALSHFAQHDGPPGSGAAPRSSTLGAQDLNCRSSGARTSADASATGGGERGLTC